MTDTSKTPTQENPQNPYKSFLVAASAGCGKTYQLSQRFLSLVAAGADPAQILTVTYTRKAVAEMRERIVSDAMKLAMDKKEQQTFDDRLQAFFAAAVSECSALGIPPPPPPRSALDTAEVILAATQTIKISTIDSVFYEWSNKFGDELLGQPEYIPTPAEMLGALEKQRLDVKTEQAAYLKFIAQATADVQDVNAPAIQLDDLPDQSFDAALTQSCALDAHETYVWACEQALQQAHQQSGSLAQTALLEHPVPESPDSEEGCLKILAQEFSAIINQLSNPDSQGACRDALATGSVTQLNEAGLLTKDWTVSKAKLKGRARDGVAGEIAAVEELLVKFQNAQKIRKLNEQGRVLFQVRRLMKDARTELKQSQRIAEFSDLTKVVYKLFASDQAAGTRYLIQRSVRHLLLDEFQDTSRSQWFVFHEIATELLSGEASEDSYGNEFGSENKMRNAALRGTVFLVGDEKQSIYGYREADPEVLIDAVSQLSPRGLCLAPLNASFRSAQITLDFVNAVFSAEESQMQDFPPHSTALRGSAPVVPNVGRIAVMEPVIPDEDRPDTSEDEQEAENIASYLSKVLAGDIPSPVWDKNLSDKGGFRAIRPGDCAILYRSKTKTMLIESALRTADVPFIREEAQGFFERPEIMDASNLVSFLAKPSDMAALSGILRSPFGRITNEALQLALVETMDLSKLATRAQAVLRRLDQRGYVIARTLLNATNDSSANEIKASHAVFRQIMGETNAAAAYKEVYPSPDNELAAANLTRFAEILVDLESRGHRTFALQSKALSDLATLNETGTSAPSTNAVRLMTVHKSKGLEFPFVALVDSAKDWLGSERYWLRGNLGLNPDNPQSVTPGIFYIGRAADRPKNDAHFEGIKTKILELNQAEMRRLLYVALTRAKQYLFLSGSMKDLAGVETTYLGKLLNASKNTVLNDGGTRSEIVLDKTVVHCLASNGIDSIEVEAEAETVSRYPAELAGILSSKKNSPVPSEIRVKSPSAHMGQKQTLDDSAAIMDSSVNLTIDQEAARIHGLMVHAILELSSANSKRWESPEWQQYTWNELNSSKPCPIEEKERGLERALAEAKAVLESDAWSLLMKDSVTVLPEIPLAYLKGSSLVYGRADLLVQKKNGAIWAVDYKSSTADPEKLSEFSVQQGYDVQVRHYCTALRAAFPQAEVRGALLFTARAVLLEV